MITLTKELLLSVRTPKGGFTGRMLSVLNVPWPPKSGWLVELQGKQITEEKWAEIVESSQLNPTKVVGQ